MGYWKSCRGCNNAKRYDVQPTLGPDHGSQHKGSQLLPLRDSRLQSALLTRPNGQLTRAGQFYHSITGRRPPSRQFDESQPLIRDGPNDYILSRRGARKLVRSLQANGQYQSGRHPDPPPPTAGGSARGQLPALRRRPDPGQRPSRSAGTCYVCLDR